MADLAREHGVLRSAQATRAKAPWSWITLNPATKRQSGISLEKSPSRRSPFDLVQERLWISSGLPTIREVEIGIPFGVAQDPTYLGRRFYVCRPGLRFAHGTGPRASSTTAA